ncbi:hypothetical protein QTP86_003805 [Hemibagrus guttatus]|nr:hypothetical protein QTP86_003805 [Hemibagrus guttatus]
MEILGGEKYVSCSVVLPALCHLSLKMAVSEDDPAYVVRFKDAYKEDMRKSKENPNIAWPKIATALDYRFKTLKCIPKAERAEVWETLGKMLKEKELAPHYSDAGSDPQKKKIGLLLMGSDTESDDETSLESISLARYRAEPSISLEQCPLHWWSAHSRSHDKLATTARKYLATLASTVPSQQPEILAPEKPGSVLMLKKEECCEEFRQKFRQALGGQVVLPDDWETTEEVIRVTGRKVLVVSSGRRKEVKETWWWNEEVQDSVQRKRLAKKKWDMGMTEENRQEYKESQCRVKREVSKAKQKAYDKLY